MIKGNFAEDRTVLEELERTHELLVVMNDGRSWIDSNREILGRRIRDAAKTTRIVLLHPGSDFLPVLIRKNGKTIAQKIEEIKRSFNALEGDRARPEAIEFRGHHGFNPCSLILTDDFAFVSSFNEIRQSRSRRALSRISERRPQAFRKCKAIESGTLRVSGPVVLESGALLAEPCVDCDVAGYIVLRARESYHMLHEAPVELQSELGVTLSRLEVAILKVVKAEHVYIVRFSEAMAALHFHLFPRTHELAEQYLREAPGVDAGINGPLLFDWARRKYRVESLSDSTIATARQIRIALLEGQIA